MVFIFDMQRTSCSRRTLAVGDFAVVERCSCGSVHLTIGAVTLRLAASAIAPLADTLAEATVAIAGEHACPRRSSPEVLS